MENLFFGVTLSSTKLKIQLLHLTPCSLYSRYTLPTYLKYLYLFLVFFLRDMDFCGACDLLSS